MNRAKPKPAGSDKASGIAASQCTKAGTVLLKILDLALHPRVSQKLAEWEVPPLAPPMPLAMLKTAKEEVRAMLGLNPPLVVKQRRKWLCVGNLRAFFLARAALAEGDEILCLEVGAKADEIDRRLLLELVMQPALLGARREDIDILADIAARAEDEGLALPKGRHRDAIAYVASLYRLERRQLKTSAERAGPAGDGPQDGKPETGIDA